MADRPLFKKPYIVKPGTTHSGAAPARAPAEAPGDRTSVPARSASAASAPHAPESAGFTPAPRSVRATRDKNESIVVQIGLDFGTCYSKCVCRDLDTDRAWVHLPRGSEGEDLPFLIPCSLEVRDGKFVYEPDHRVHYPEQGLYHLKVALAAVGSGRWDERVLDVYRRHANSENQSDLAAYVEAAATYFLAVVLADIRRGVKERFGDFGAHHADLMLVNMAIPVADMTTPGVHEIFLRVLRRAWTLSQGIARLELATAANQRAMLLKEMAPPTDSDHCFLYPEVSASVQGLVRAGSARDGTTYLCSDVGSGTVDMSLFVFHRPDDDVFLTYLDARVLPLGSSQIEFRASAQDTSPDTRALEQLRARKERGFWDDCMDTIFADINTRIARAICEMFMRATQKGQLPEAMARAVSIRIGGGYAPYPYGQGINDGYDLHFKQTVRDRPRAPATVGIALPRDLDLAHGSSAWMARLYVAYGLSFFRDNLTPHTFPPDLPDLPLSERRIRHGVDKEAITKDMC